MTDHELPRPLDDALTAHPDAARLRAVWAALAPMAATSTGTEERDAAWRAIETRLAAAPAVAPVSRRLRLLRPLLLAAVVLVAVGVTLQLVATARYAAPPGADREVVLADGSHVHLDGGAAVWYRRGALALLGVAPAERDVTLTGDAYFDVAHDGRPFVVHTFNARVRVVGTRFEVRTTEGATGRTRVGVETGRVELSDASKATVSLGAGEGAEVATDGHLSAIRPVAVNQLAPWRTGGFSAINEPLAVILDELGRHAGVTIALQRRSVAADRLTLYYPRPTDAATILRDLCTTQGWTFRPIRHGFSVE